MNDTKSLIDDHEKAVWKLDEELSDRKCFQCGEKIQNDDGCACSTEEREVACDQATQARGKLDL